MKTKPKMIVNEDKPLFFSAKNGSQDMKQKMQRARRRTRRRGYFFPGDSMKSAVLAELVRDLEKIPKC